MSTPFREIPKLIKKNLYFYRRYFTRPQFANFQVLISGLIVNENKTLQDINDSLSEKTQSSLNRFVTNSDWDMEKINDARIKQIKKHRNLGNGTLISDTTLLHKTGRHMEKANYHYSGITKKKEWGHLLVDSIFVEPCGDSIPLKADIYVRKVDADTNTPFRTIRSIVLGHVDYAIKQKIPFKVFMGDCGIYADFLIRELKFRKKKHILGVRVTNKISINGKKRITIGEYLDTLTDADFTRYVINDEVYFLHTKEVSIRGVGKEKLLISYKQGDEKNIKIYVTDLLNASGNTLMHLLLKRWKVEGWHRDAKQHLGLEDYQVRKYGGIQKVVLAVLIAYTLLILCTKQTILQPLKRGLETIGEKCRFLRLIALKGSNWIKRVAKRIDKLREVMNNYVFVKNAKA